MMKKPTVFVLAGVTLFIGLTWLSLVPLRATQLSTLAPIVVIPLLVLVAVKRRGRAPAVVL